MIEYKGYVGVVTYQTEEEMFHGRVANISDVVDFWGTSVEELKHEMAKSIDVYLEFCKEEGLPPNRPFSGRLSLRLDPVLHNRVATAAAKEHKSINGWIVERLDEVA